MNMAKIRGRKLNVYKFGHNVSRTFYLDETPDRLKSFSFTLLEQLNDSQPGQRIDGATWKVTLSAREVVELAGMLEPALRCIPISERISYASVNWRMTQ